MKSIVDDRFARQPNILPLAERASEILQVLLPEFGLAKQDAGLRLEVHVDEDSLSLVDAAGKADFFQVIREQRAGGFDPKADLEKRLASFYAGEHQAICRLDCPRFPFRWANGGALPILRYRYKDYFCLFYRDIFPIGWNIANGSSDNLEEMLDPSKVVRREFGEELFICDTEARIIYDFDPGDQPADLQKKPFEQWEQVLGVRGLEDFDRRPLPILWVDGPDRVRAMVRDSCLETEGYFLSVTPEDNGIEVDRVVRVDLDVGGTVRLLDGELRAGELLNRLVGLFEVEGFEERLGENDFRPSLHFHGGVEKGLDALEESVNAYLESLRERDLRSRSLVESNERADPRFDLCPITRAVVERYFNWTTSPLSP